MDRSTVEALLSRGCSTRDIARELGCSQTTVRGLLSTYELSTVGRPGAKRSYSDESLVAALPLSKTWTELAQRVSVGSRRASAASLRRRAAELELDASHLDENNGRTPVRAEPPPAVPSDFSRFGETAEFLAAAWYTAHGYQVSLTGERCAFDLFAFAGSGQHPRRVQVKSSTRRNGAGWRVSLTTSKYDSSAPAGANGKRVETRYSAQEIDEFFIVIADLSMFRIPIAATAGRAALTLPGRFAKFRVDLPQHPHASKK